MLTHNLLSLPPILYNYYRNPISSYSKALRGLSVQSRVIRIFTYTTISPGPLLRQRPNRYTIRAGRNLPDKEFRYLRTVIVTAAVHWGFNSMLAHLLLTFQHWAGVSPYTSSFDLAETCVFGKQSLGPLHCDRLASAPLLPKLRGHFAEFLNKGYPARLRIFSSPTCVGLRYGHLSPYLATFLASVNSLTSLLVFTPHHRSASQQTYFTICQPHDLDALVHQRASTILLCHCLIFTTSVVPEYLPVVHHLRLSPST